VSDPTTDKPPEIADQAARPPRPAGDTPTDPPLPDYKGAPLDAERGPGLGCFWAQVVLLVVLLVVTPLSVVMSAPSWFSAALLIILLVLLFFVGQTMIFLLRLVAADRRSRRRPMGANARRTVGQLEDAAVTPAPSEASPSPVSPAAPASPASPADPAPSAPPASDQDHPAPR
jgi:hypothetical protein